MTMTRVRPNRSARAPAVHAPAAAPSSADDTTKPMRPEPMPNCDWIASTAPLMTALS